MKTVWMFPGQGSQWPGMGRELLRDSKRAREILTQAESICGFDLLGLCQRGPQDSMNRPSRAEMLITAVGIGYIDWLKERNMQPEFTAGYSAGEVPALYAAGVFQAMDALRVAKLRGELFEEYVSNSCRMITVTGMNVVELISKIQQQTELGHDIALGAWNGPMHATVVGDEHQLIQFEGDLLRAGCQVSRVQVSGKWHTHHLDEASIRLEEKLAEIPFQDPVVPHCTSASGMMTSDVNAIRKELALGVSKPVLWMQIVVRLMAQGVERFLECSSGRVLFGLMRWNERGQEVDTLCVEDRNGGMRPLRRIELETKN